jgi:hypothetical protein
MRDSDTLHVPSGYHLDYVDDPCVISLCRPDGTIVARFTYAANLEEITRAAEEDALR